MLVNGTYSRALIRFREDIVHNRRDKDVVPESLERIGERIILVRGQKVLLDADLAALYGVATKRFNERSVVIRRASRLTSCSAWRLKSGIL